MKIQCPNCGISKEANDSKIPDKGCYVGCRKCGHRFFVKKENNFIEKKEILSSEEDVSCPVEQESVQTEKDFPKAEIAGVLKYPKPSPNKRICAILIDFAIVTFLQSLLHLFGINTKNFIFQSLFFFLYVFRDSYKGQSPGKVLIGLKVTDLEGNPISLSASFKRNIILFWEYIVYAPMLLILLIEPNFILKIIAIHIGLIVIGVFISIIEYIKITYSYDGRRIGDKLAKTKVIDLHPDRGGWRYFFLSLIIIFVSVLLQMMMR
ncbi:MAG: hypothetical protein BWK80_59455 [Desulfobacteraceae bacterium IS3]|nr:MAG: hypothetical protein BWK80_59455 [Desulfobacteraceae bacterium IS3]